MANKANAYWKNVLTIVPIVGAVVATIIYLLRLYCRRLKALGLLLEDYLMGAGLIISYCATAFVIDSEHSPPSSRRDIKIKILTIKAAFNGVGLPVASLPKHERMRIQFVCLDLPDYDLETSMGNLTISCAGILDDTEVLGPVNGLR
jgi:hypothetical protein